MNRSATVQATTTKPAVRVGAQEIAHTRRQFLAKTGSLAALGGLASLGINTIQPTWAQDISTRLVIDRRILEVLGRPTSVYGIRQFNGTSGIVLEPGQPFNVELENRLAEETIIHWHGQTPPYPQDGVVSEGNPSLLAGATRRYDFVPRSGTHWMHSHIGLQEQLLLAAPMIVRTPEENRADVQEVTILLADFTFRDPVELLDNLKREKKSGDMPGMNDGSKPTPAMPGMESMPGMPATAQNAASALDLNDVEYDAFLVNDRTLEDPQIVAVERGGRVRLRIINGATTSAFHIDLGRLDGTLVAVDGNPVQPVIVRRFGMAVAQRVDILVALPQESGACPILA